MIKWNKRDKTIKKTISLFGFYVLAVSLCTVNGCTTPLIFIFLLCFVCVLFQYVWACRICLLPLVYNFRQLLPSHRMACSVAATAANHLPGTTRSGFFFSSVRSAPIRVLFFLCFSCLFTSYWNVQYDHLRVKLNSIIDNTVRIIQLLVWW